MNKTCFEKGSTFKKKIHEKNRTHEIAHALTAETANISNIITLKLVG